MCPSESQEPPTRALFADFDALQVDELQAHQRKTRVDRLTDVEPHNENSLNLKRMMAMTPELVLECPADLTHPDERALGGNRDKWSGKVGLSLSFGSLLLLACVRLHTTQASIITWALYA